MEELITFTRKFLHIVLLFAALVSLSIAAALLTENGEIKATFGGIALSALATSLFTGALISYAERIGWLSNYRDEMSELRVKIDQLPTALEARVVFGLEGIQDNFDEAHFLHEHSGGEICWLNTYFREWGKKPEMILRALDRGSRVRLLFLDPGATTRNERAYYSYDGSRKESWDAHLDAYQKSLERNYAQCVRLVEQVRDERPELDEDALQIRFYEDSPQLPLIIACASDHDGEFDTRKFTPIRGASGFYLDQTSSSLPYITWSRHDAGEKGMVVAHLYKFFDKKWNSDMSRSLVEIRADFAPGSSGILEEHGDHVS